jgi:hypothetical protein
MTYGNTQYSNQNSSGKKIYENMHYNQKKQTYKTMECNLLDGGTIFVRVSEGQKGGNRNSAGIALDIREASELIKILEVAVEEAIRKKINE